jgi:hypothetical protein
MDADAPPRRRWRFHVCSALLALPLIYVLSSGPAIGYARCRVTRAPFEPAADVRFIIQFYQPFESLIQNTPLEDAYMNYTTWWTVFIFRITGTELRVH